MNKTIQIRKLLVLTPLHPRIFQALKYLFMTVLFFTYGACVDIRFPTERITEEIINFPPKIDRSTISPAFGVEPIRIDVGIGCSGAIFSGPKVTDLDLNSQGRIAFKWTLTVKINEVAEILPPETLREDSVSPNILVGEETLISIPDLEINRLLLNGTFFGGVERLIGQTHRLNLHVTDASNQFANSTAQNEDSVYWFLTFVDECGGNI